MAHPETSRLLVVDLEATCWESKRPGEIIEIGICIANLETKTIDRPASFIVLPHNLDISPFCTSLTGHTQNNIKENGKPLGERLNTIAKLYSLQTLCWSSWGWYDRNQLNRECIDKGIVNPFSENHMNIKQLHAMFRGLRKGVGVENALKIEGMEFKGRPHSGIDDSVNIARLLIKMFRS